MSLNVENLKFTIFGHGYNATRNDSGEGQVEPDYHSGNYTSAIIDQTGDYVWLSNGSTMKRYKIDTWEEEAHSVPVGDLTHPTNADNDYGLSCRLNAITVFDLSDGEIITTVNVPDSNMAQVPLDSVIDEDEITYITRIQAGRQDLLIHNVDIVNQTYDKSSVLYNRSVYGFVDEDTCYTLQPAQWQTDRTILFGTGMSGGTQWSDTAPESNPTYSNFINMDGALTGNGKIYAPTFINGKWRLGEYTGNTAPDFATPSPIKTIGEFASSPSLMWDYQKFNICYSNGRTKSAFATSIGTFYTDFDTKLVKIADDPNDFKPLAMSNKYIIGQKGTTEVCVLKI